MEPLIRPYRPSDHAACRALWVELVQHHRAIYADSTIGGDDPGEWFGGYLANLDRKETWVAELDGTIVGMAGLMVRGDEGEIEPVVVTAAVRCRGVGRTLLRHAIESARQYGVRFLSVKPTARNRDAVAFFAEAGFNIVGQVELFQDLNPSAGRQWEDGLTIHSTQLRF